MNKNLYYNYDRIISYNAFLNILIGERGVGKSYGIAKYVVKEFIKKKKQFVYVRRYKKELAKSIKEFFSALTKNNEFEGHSFKISGDIFYIDDEVAGYAIPLSTAQQLKSSNYPNVWYIIYDEFIIEEGQGRYLRNEVKSFLGLIETTARTRDVNVFMLGNAADEINPYFLFFDLSLPYGNDIKLYKDGLILLQYMKNIPYREAKKKTKFGQLVEGTEYSEYAIDNKFNNVDKNFIEKKTGSSQFLFSFVYKGKILGVWIDYSNSKMYVSNDVIANGLCFATTTEDHKPNTLLYSIAKKYNCWNMFVQNYKLGNVYFENMKIKTISRDIIKNLILRS